MTAQPTTEAPAEPRPVLPFVLVGLPDMVELFPVVEQTVYRWRTRKNLPEPLLTVGHTPMWELPIIERFAAERHHKLDQKVLRRIRREQGH